MTLISNFGLPGNSTFNSQNSRTSAPLRLCVKTLDDGRRNTAYRLVLSLPWELLHDGRGFLPLRARAPVTIVRRLPEATLPELPVPFTPPLRVLLVTARPEGAGFVDPRGIARELLDEVQPEVTRGAITLEFLRPATLPALRARLSDANQPAVHILHFDGHGAFAGDFSRDGLRLSGGIGKLAFENDAGELHLVAANDLAQVLGNSGVKLAVLTACQSGLGSEDDAFSSVAAQLINSGVDAVVAMSASVLVASATRYVEAFYRALAGGQGAPLAHERARQALHDDPARHTHQRRRDEAGQPVTLRDWWLPHFYQQRPLTLQATTAPADQQNSPLSVTSVPSVANSAVSSVADLPQPRYGFSGRARELLQIERHLLNGKLVVVQGFGGVGKTALAENYAQRYAALARYLYHKDQRNPQAVRALVRRELPNLRQALMLLLTADDLDAAVEMTTNIAWFLNYFGLLRERDALRQQVEQALAARPAGETLSRAEYLRESGLGEDEFSRGELQAAYERFRRLLARIGAGPAGQSRGPGTYEHQLTLAWLARCLRVNGQHAAAEEPLRAALGIIDDLTPAADAAPPLQMERGPGGEVYQRQRGGLLTDLGDVLQDQGNYAAARDAYEESLKVDEALGDQRGKGVTLSQLGALALRQRDYAETARRYREGLTLFQRLNEPALEATAWHQLGMVAQKQRIWAEAERCYRETLAIREQHSISSGVAQTCNQLALVAQGVGRPAEAEGWYRRALAIDENLGSEKAIAIDCSNLAGLLLSEVQADRMDASHLDKARAYAERALAIKERLDLSTETWITLQILAEIAAQTGQAEQAAAYRSRERETFAAFPGNRWHIDQKLGWLIAAIVAAAQGDYQAQAKAVATFPLLESRGWRIAAATRRIWAGERDWHALASDIDRNSALLVKRALEGLGVGG